MKAVGVWEYGGPEALRVVELPDPEPGPGEVLIRVQSAAVNPHRHRAAGRCTRRTADRRGAALLPRAARTWFNTAASILSRTRHAVAVDATGPNSVG
jgi:hypothetical protein